MSSQLEPVLAVQKSPRHGQEGTVGFDLNTRLRGAGIHVSVQH